jgi:hypothetical protein
MLLLRGGAHARAHSPQRPLVQEERVVLRGESLEQRLLVSFEHRRSLHRGRLSDMRGDARRDEPYGGVERLGVEPFSFRDKQPRPLRSGHST